MRKHYGSLFKPSPVNSAKKLQKHAGGGTGPDSTIISEFINVFGSS